MIQILSPFGLDQYFNELVEESCQPSWSFPLWCTYVSCYNDLIKLSPSVNSNEGCDTSKILYEVSKIGREKILMTLRILEDSGDSLGIPGDSWGFLGIPRDSWGFLRIFDNFVESKSWGFSGFCGILPDSLGILKVSLGFLKKCTRILMCRAPRTPKR